MRARSLSTRLLASVSVLLVLFFSLTVFVLDYLYRQLSDNAIRTRLELQVSNLLSASDEYENGMVSPGDSLSETRFANLGSGLYGQINRGTGELIWGSESLTGTGLDLYQSVAPGRTSLRTLRTHGGAQVLALSVGIQWEFTNREVHRFVYSVAENLEPYRQELQQFRAQLFGWFTGLMILLLAALAVLFRWVLRPVRMIEREMAEIEAGRANELAGRYPRELAGLTANMNALLKSERERLARYRNTLGNLAHSLKTPLAVVRSLADTPQLQEQVTRMDEIVSYQLKRAAMSGGTGLGSAPVEVKEVVHALRDTLLKVYAGKGIEIRADIDARARYIGDRGDLMEIVGNLLDNACKFCRKQVSVSAQPLVTPGTRREGVVLVVEDDGPGIAPEQREHVLKRGARLDERVSGQGIGLSVVQELAQLSGGGIDIHDSPLGGGKITVRLPAP